ncbi:amphi-Trp domain-containing protein [Natrialbaceae archaeon GCM10025810]|uniref:amphi-Trp domain-containing protein n=1 Tax=Halovalidus salilacus TaxID=3075124 RepID=UPI00361D5378
MADDSYDRAYAADRTDLADLFAECADAFERGRTLRLRTGEETLSIDVPDRVTVELEADRDEDSPTPTAGLEIELEWEDGGDRSSIRVKSDEEEDEVSQDGSQRGRSAEEATTDPGMATMPVEAIARSSRREASEGSDPTEADEPVPATSEADSGRTSRFEVYRDRAGEWRWRLVHWNGNVIADSGEGYASRSNAERAVRGVMRNAPGARIERLEPEE